MPFQFIPRETLKLLGFRSGGDLLASTLGVKLYSGAALKGLALGAVVAGLTAFCTRWIWNPPSALCLLLFLDLANGRYGFQVAKKLRGEPFKWSEFQRLGGVMIATIIVMAVVRNAINAYPYYELLADAVFGWLFATKAQKVVSKMVALKVSEDGLPSVLLGVIKGLLSTRLGQVIVDAKQVPPPAEPPATDSTPPLNPISANEKP